MWTTVSAAYMLFITDVVVGINWLLLLELVIFSARQHICYSALYAIARPSVRLSVTRVDQSKTADARITQPSPQSSPMTLVSRCLTLIHTYKSRYTACYQSSLCTIWMQHVHYVIRKSITCSLLSVFDCPHDRLSVSVWMVQFTNSYSIMLQKSPVKHPS